MARRSRLSVEAGNRLASGWDETLPTVGLVGFVLLSRTTFPKGARIYRYTTVGLRTSQGKVTGCRPEIGDTVEIKLLKV